MATETEPARQYGGDLDTATLDDLAASIDIAEIEQAYRLLELEEARVDVEISEHIEARHDVETRFASLSLLQDQLETIVDDLVPVQSAIDTTAANAGAISSHVRFLDRELTKYESALRAVEDTERLKHDADDLLAAMQRKDIDVAAALINRYLAVSAKVLENPFVAFASKGEPAPEIIGGARRELVERVTYMFETAAESGNTKEISRCVRLFPLLGEELQGLDMYAGFLCSLVADKARVPGEPKGSVYALRLTRLFEVIAVVVDAHFPVIETHYGPGRMIRVIQRLQIEGAKRAAMILDFFEEERHVKRRLTQIHHADASAARNKSRAQLLSDKERPPRMSEEVVTDDDLKEITSILTELVLIGRQIAVFSRFLESRARPELSVLTDKAGGAVTDKTGLAIRADAVPSVFLKPDDVLKLIPLSMQQSVLGNAKKAIEFDPQTGLVVDTPLTVRLAWLTDTYITFEAFFVNSSVAKVMALDDTESLSGWSESIADALSSDASSLAKRAQPNDAAGWSQKFHKALDVAKTSSCVGDLFFIIKATLEHAIAIQQPSAVEATAQTILGTLNSVYLSVLESRALTKWSSDRSSAQLGSAFSSESTTAWRLPGTASSEATSPAAPKLSAAARTQRQILVALNNLDLSSEYLDKTVTALQAKVETEWQRIAHAEHLPRAKRALETLAAFAAKFSHARQRAIEQLAAHLLKPYVRSILQQSYRDIKYVLTDEEFNDVQNDNLFQKRFVMKLGALTRQLRVRLTGANFASVFDCIVATLRVDWEKAIRQSKFNMLGGIMFEKDVREIQRHLEQECGVSLRQKFARLVHTADVLAVEGAADVKHIVAAAGSVAGSASLSRDETRAVLANRIDITEKDIAALNI